MLTCAYAWTIDPRYFDDVVCECQPSHVIWTSYNTTWRFGLLQLFLLRFIQMCQCNKKFPPFIGLASKF